jgi:hypothetical protein
MVIGDMTVTQTHVITPSGTFPVAHAQWSVTDMSTTTKRMSQTGIVLALIGFFLVCILSLFFLLMTETQTTGYVQVAVTDGNRMHVTNIPATSPQTMVFVSEQVNYARSLAYYQ